MKDKRMLYIATMGMGAVIIVIVLIVILVNAFGGRTSYEKVEEKMKKAAESYLKANESQLPKNNGDEITLTADTLAGAKKMKQLNKIVPKGSNCTGNVVVTKNGEKYLYSAILDCGSNYKTRKLNEVITDRKNIVIEGDGLYAKEDGYIFRGENVNNVVEIDEKKWAIIDIDNEGYIRLININNNKLNRVVWDNRYNVEHKNSEGINDFSVSRLKDSLNNFEEREIFISDEFKSYVAIRKWCIGKRSQTNLEINNNEECLVMSEEQIFGLPYVSDTVAASIDENCKKISDPSCYNYNYFGRYAISSWTMTGIKETTNQAYYLVGAGIFHKKTSLMYNAVPTIYLSKNVMYASGDGSIDNPYILK